MTETSLDTLIEQYAAGPSLLRNAVRGMSRDELLARPVAGKWSTLEVVAHVADFEPVYVDRMKRILAENEPTMFGGNPDHFAASLHYHQRDLEAELEMIEATRRHMLALLRATDPADFDRQGRHSEAGLLPLREILRRIAGHIPHHVPFIAEKRAALGR